MEVTLAIVLGALVGGVFFMLLERWQRKNSVEVATPTAEPQPAAPVWMPSGGGGWAPPTCERPAPPQPPVWTPPEREERTEPLPPSRWVPASEERTEPAPPRPLWTPPSSASRWDDDDRYRGPDDEDDPPPPGLWSGWARR